VQRQRLPSLRFPPIVFAHRGARAHAAENTVEAFDLAERLGASGLESDVWLTADDQVVLDHDGVFRAGLRRRRIRNLARADLPAHIPTLEEVLGRSGPLELSLDVKDPAAAGPTIAVVERLGRLDRLWLCHSDLEVLVGFADPAQVNLVNSTKLRDMKEGPERRAARLAELGIRAVNLRHPDWTGGLTTLFHRFDVLAFGWDAQYDRVVRDLVWMGIDGLYGDDVPMMVEVVGRETGGETP
jgi:glycerophosphoryl diester phosphodiesterase